MKEYEVKLNTARASVDANNMPGDIIEVSETTCRNMLRAGQCEAHSNAAKKIADELAEERARALEEAAKALEAEADQAQAAAAAAREELGGKGRASGGGGEKVVDQGAEGGAGGAAPAKAKPSKSDAAGKAGGK